MGKTVLCNRCDFRKGDCIDGRYIVNRSLGEGTFGQVFRVTDSSGKQYALKLLKLWVVPQTERERLMRRFEQEYETGKIPSHYLVHSQGWGVVQGNPYIVMEYCPGGDLGNAVKSGCVTDLSKAAKEILFGLRDLHRCGKVHRDLKPENVLLRQDASMVLTDFGIAGNRNKRMTETDLFGKPKQIFGTYPYMPPEQLNPKNRNNTVLPTTDIFSFGAMMYWVVTGLFPFGSLETDADLMPYLENVEAGCWFKEPLLKTAKRKLWLPVIEGCLIPDFRKRLQNTEEVLGMLPQDTGGSQSIYHSMESPIGRPNLQVRNGVLLRVMQGEEYGKEYRLDTLLQNGSKVITVGRYSEDIYNRIAVKEDDSCYISRCHCTVELNLENGQWMIRDGQWRSSCPIASRSHEVFPCKFCTAWCSSAHHYSWKRSLNGTYVNSQEVDADGMFITPGDIISVGDVKFRVEGY